jgi:hypothetical protein
MLRVNSQTVSVYIFALLIFFQGISGILGGISLIVDPTGGSLNIPLHWLEGSPFKDYLIPGLILFFVLGFLPLLVFYGLLKQYNWSWYGAILIGIALIIWIITEILIIGYHPQPPLQLIYGLIGLSILILIPVPSVRRYCNNRN